jgi:hypothetical protein
MQITKRVERLYSLAQFENIKIVLEATEDIGDKDPVQEYAKLTELIMTQLKIDAQSIMSKKN